MEKVAYKDTELSSQIEIQIVIVPLVDFDGHAQARALMSNFEKVRRVHTYNIGPSFDRPKKVPPIMASDHPRVCHGEELIHP